MLPLVHRVAPTLVAVLGALTGGFAGGARGEAPRLVEFTIVAGHEAQRPSTSPPGHEPGGDWTYYDCRLSAPGPQARFLFGTRGATSTAGWASYGRGRVSVPTREDGAGILAAVAGALATPTPPPEAPGRLVPLDFTVWSLPRPAWPAAWSGRPGVAQQWVVSFEVTSTMLHCWYDRASGRGELSLAGPCPARDTVAVVAGGLRDGYRPERAPSDDPDVVATGPRLTGWRTVQSEPGSDLTTFTPDGATLLWRQWLPERPEGPSFLRSMALEEGVPGTPAAAVNVARFERSLSQMVPLDPAGARLLVVEDDASTPAESSWAPSHVWLVERASGTLREVKGPWEQAGSTYTSVNVAPGARYAAVATYHRPSGRPRTDGGVAFVDLRTGATAVPAAPGLELWPVGWTPVGDGRQAALLRSSSATDPTSPPRWFRADPASGALTPAATGPATFPSPWTPAPGGRLRARVDGTARLLIEDTTADVTRSYTFHPDDRRYVGSPDWVSQRYLRFRTRRLGFLDAVAMKLSYAGASDELLDTTFSPDFRFVAERTERGLRVGRVLLP